MKRFNNKGITLVEIIISVALISIVLIFLFSLLIQVNNENSDNEVRASYLVNQSTFIKQIEEDILDNYLYGVFPPNYTDSNTGAKITVVEISTTNTTNDKYHLYLPRWTGLEEDIFLYAIRWRSDADDPNNNLYAHLFYYKTTDNRVLLGYYKENFKQTVELEQFDWELNRNSILSSAAICLETKNASYQSIYVECKLPIIGPDYNDYSINFSYAPENIV